jgi:hypothetical protein
MAWMYDNNIYLTSLDDFSDKRLTNFPSARKTYKIDPRASSNLKTVQNILRWSPDGSGIFFSYGTEGQGPRDSSVTLHILEINIHDSTVTQVTQSGNEQLDYFIDQSPDGRMIYYAVVNIIHYVYQAPVLKRRDIRSLVFDDVKLPEMVSVPQFHLSLSRKLIAYDWFPEWGKNVETRAISIMGLHGSKDHRIIDGGFNPKWMLDE